MKITKEQSIVLRERFLKYLIYDSETTDMRRKDFNQAIFDKEQGWQVFNNTDLSMIMDKFDKAVNELLEN